MMIGSTVKKTWGKVSAKRKNQQDDITNKNMAEKNVNERSWKYLRVESVLEKD